MGEDTAWPQLIMWCSELENDGCPLKDDERRRTITGSGVGRMCVCELERGLRAGSGCINLSSVCTPTSREGARFRADELRNILEKDIERFLGRWKGSPASAPEPKVGDVVEAPFKQSGLDRIRTSGRVASVRALRRVCLLLGGRFQRSRSCLVASICCRMPRTEVPLLSKELRRPSTASPPKKESSRLVRRGLRMM
jgi:hypothetical protein